MVLAQKVEDIWIWCFICVPWNISLFNIETDETINKNSTTREKSILYEIKLILNLFHIFQFCVFLYSFSNKFNYSSLFPSFIQINFHDETTRSPFVNFNTSESWLTVQSLIYLNSCSFCFKITNVIQT